MHSVPPRSSKPCILILMLVFFASACCPCGKRDATPDKAPAAGLKAAPAAGAETTPPPTAAPSGHVRCEGELVSVESKPWHQQVSSDQGGDSVDDGVSLLATFRLTAPPEAAGRKVGVLFKYAKNSAPPSASDAGKKFSLDLPRTFLDGTFATLDNDQVINLRALEQPHEK
jgi:hypothetical protein